GRPIDVCPQWFLSSPFFGFVGKIQTQVHFILFAQINSPDSGTCLQQVLEGIHLGWESTAFFSGKSRDIETAHYLVSLAVVLKGGAHRALAGGRPIEVSTNGIG